MGNAMFKFKQGLAYVGAVLLIAALLVVLLWEPSSITPSGVHEVPTLTAWGKIFSALLLAALGVAYLVWRRPIARAQAILETSPLGSGSPTPPLVDWRLYFKTLLVLEALSLAGIGIVRLVARPLSTLDSLGVIGAAAIVALVVHLLILARSGGSRGT